MKTNLRITYTENGTPVVKGNGWKLETPDGCCFAVIRNQEFTLALLHTRLEDGELWRAYLTGDVWHDPLTRSGTIDCSVEPPVFTGLNEAIESMFAEVEEVEYK